MLWISSGIWFILFWGIQLGLCFFPTGWKVDRRNTSPWKDDFCRKTIYDFSWIFYVCSFWFLQRGKDEKRFQKYFYTVCHFIQQLSFRALKQKDMCIICVKVSSFRSAQSVLYGPTNCIHPPSPSPNENSEIFHDGSPQLRAFFSALLLWWIKLSLVKHFWRKQSRKKTSKTSKFFKYLQYTIKVWSNLKFSLYRALWS